MRVPDTLEEATSPAWLAEVLGVEVAAVRVGAVDQRVSTNAPIAVDGADGSHRDLWIKGYFGDIGRLARPAGISEVLFYRDLVGSVDIRTLRAVHADADLDSLASVIITEASWAAAPGSSTPCATTRPTRQPRASTSWLHCMRRRG